MIKTYRLYIPRRHYPAFDRIALSQVLCFPYHFWRWVPDDERRRPRSVEFKT